MRELDGAFWDNAQAASSSLLEKMMHEAGPAATAAGGRGSVVSDRLTLAGALASVRDHHQEVLDGLEDALARRETQRAQEMVCLKHAGGGAAVWCTSLLAEHSYGNLW